LVFATQSIESSVNVVNEGTKRAEEREKINAILSKFDPTPVRFELANVFSTDCFFDHTIAH
jgi:hypothetical protein